jgi:cytochrome c oxidase assembly factor CtaG
MGATAPRPPDVHNLEDATLPYSACSCGRTVRKSATCCPHSSHASRLALVLAGSLLAGPLSFAFIFSPVPFYGYYVHQPRLWGLSPLRDQHLGGIFMNAEQAVVMFAVLAYLFTRWTRDEDAPATRASRANSEISVP